MDVLNETIITLGWELYEQGMPKVQIAKRLGRHRETIHIWVKGIQRYGLIDFLDRYRQAKKEERKRRQVNPILKRWRGESAKQNLSLAELVGDLFRRVTFSDHLYPPFT